MIVIDACGAGELPDAGEYGDQGVNTLRHLSEAVGGLRLPSLQALGLGCIMPILGVPAVASPAIHGRLHALGPGKDSIAGHWEMMGVVVSTPLRSYPEGLDEQALRRLTQAIGSEVICNLPRNGIAAIEELGEQHLHCRLPILYTSTDSVIQLAAHIEVMPPQELYQACEAARAAMSAEHAVGRVIARPFEGVPGAFKRTGGRRDFTLTPPSRSYLQELGERGVSVHGVGKVFDLFAGVGIAHSHPGSDNAQALDSTQLLLDSLNEGLIFVNLIETDQVYGHRKDVEGFHRALQAIDARVSRWLRALRPDDLLIITADHGVDPAHPRSDHTREHAPLLAVTGDMLAAGQTGHRHDGPLSDVGASVLEWLTGDGCAQLPGESFLGSQHA